ncbi:MAG: biotin--[acetyl-CoA-carboxylase] ligase [Deltaproteobacteria bacterium]|nr:biotin--[acetyl-CoA-carboxylase] ligase [Deltaproteobacteria bacterium]
MVGRLIIRGDAESTQDLAREMALQGAPAGTAVMALNQTRGRGRMGRSWISPPGKNLALSLLLRPTLLPRDAPLLGLLASIAVAETVEDAGVPEARLRWPNDVLVSDKKIAGILSEASMDDRSVEFVIVGVGLNVNAQESDFPADLPTPATSVLMCTGRESDLEQTARRLLGHMDRLYEKLNREGSGFVPPLWESRWAHCGVRLTHKKVTGVGHGIGSDGALLLKTDQGRIERITSGEVLPAESTRT